MSGIKLESGKSYVTGDGLVVKVFRFSDVLEYCFKTDGISLLSYERWSPAGVAYHDTHHYNTFYKSSIVSEYNE
jgi:hypothetical protein